MAMSFAKREAMESLRKFIEFSQQADDIPPSTRKALLLMAAAMQEVAQIVQRPDNGATPEGSPEG